jgi:hypothetical protein
MSSRSRRAAEPSEEPDPAEVERREAAAAAFEGAGTRQGLSRWVGLALDERKRQLAPGPVGQYVGPDGTAFDIGGPAPEPRGLQEPTPYERSLLFALGNKPMYGGTVDPEVVRERRRRNKAARKARRRNRLVAAR